MQVMSLTVRAWLRYVVPLTLLAVTRRARARNPRWSGRPPGDCFTARASVGDGWVRATCAIALQLLVVAAAAPAVRALDGGAPLSQLGAFTAGVRGLVRGFVPWLTALVAVLLGGVTLVVPGVVLLVLVSMTGASDKLDAPMPQAIEDSIALARAHLPRIALVVGTIVALDLAITFAVQATFVPIVGKKVAAAKLLPIRSFVRVTALALVAIAPAIGCALAATYSHAKKRSRVPGLPG